MSRVRLAIIGCGGISSLHAQACRGGSTRDVLGPRGVILGTRGGDADSQAHFVECVAEDRGPSVTGEDGRRALEIGLTILQSSETGEKAYL